jgi:hypothetical protein
MWGRKFLCVTHTELATSVLGWYEIWLHRRAVPYRHTVLISFIIAKELDILCLIDSF